MDRLHGILRTSNPWWDPDVDLPEEGGYLRRKGLYEAVSSRVFKFNQRRSIILLGQRRVGKTVLMMQLLHDAIERHGMERQHVCFVDFDELEVTASPAEMVRAYRSMSGSGQRLILLDEVPAESDWVRTIKAITDRDKKMKVVVSGSAASISRAKRAEIALGRYLDFYIPPLLFCEFLEYTGRWPGSLPKSAGAMECDSHRFKESEVISLNDAMVDYLNFGAYPELALYEGEYTRKEIKDMLHQIMTETLLGHGVLREFGIEKGRELRRILGYLSRVNGQESNAEAIAGNVDGISKKTVSKYLEFLESTFLVRKHVKTNHGTAKSSLRNKNAKYLICNPSFPGMGKGELATRHSKKLGHLAEAAAVLQHPNHTHVYCPTETSYCRFRQNYEDIEVDIIRSSNDPEELIDLMCEVKWSDNPKKLALGKRSLLVASNVFNSRIEGAANLICSTKTTYGKHPGDGRVTFMPTSQYCMARGLETLAG